MKKRGKESDCQSLLFRGVHSHSSCCCFFSPLFIFFVFPSTSDVKPELKFPERKPGTVSWGVSSTFSVDIRGVCVSSFLTGLLARTHTHTHTLSSVTAQSYCVANLEGARSVETLLDCAAGMDFEGLVGPPCQGCCR